jgi:hypothetical protein
MKHCVFFILVCIFSLTSHTSFKLCTLARRVKITALLAIKPTVTRQTAQLHLIGANPHPEIEISRIQDENQDSSKAPIAAIKKLAVEEAKPIVTEKKAVRKNSVPSSASKAEAKAKSTPNLKAPPSVLKEPSTSATRKAPKVVTKRAVKSKPDSITEAAPKTKSKSAVKKTPAAAKSVVTTAGPVKTIRKPTVKSTKAPRKATTKKMAVVSKSAEALFKMVVAVSRVRSTAVKGVTVPSNTALPVTSRVVKATKSEEIKIEAEKVEPVAVQAVRVQALRPVTVRPAKVKPVTTRTAKGKPAVLRQETMKTTAMKAETVSGLTTRKDTWATANVSLAMICNLVIIFNLTLSPPVNCAFIKHNED